MKTIRLRYPARCADCGSYLCVGSLAAYYGPGRVFGRGCHSVSETGLARVGEWLPGAVASWACGAADLVTVVDTGRFRPIATLMVATVAELGLERVRIEDAFHTGISPETADQLDDVLTRAQLPLGSADFARLHSCAAPFEVVVWRKAGGQWQTLISMPFESRQETMQLAQRAVELLNDQLGKEQL